MTPTVTVYTTPPEALVKLLADSHLLHALPLIRRLRFTKFPGGITEHTRILWSSRLSLDQHHHLATTTTTATATATTNADGDSNGNSGGDDVSRDSQEGVPFAAAYLDFSRGPETELWIYSSMEHRLGENAAALQGTGLKEASPVSKAYEKEELACAVALLREVKHQQDAYFGPVGSARAAAREFPTILVGNLNEAVREGLAGAGMAIFSTGLYDKWVFRADELPDVAVHALPGDSGEAGRRWVWDRVRREDIPLTISRTSIPRKERTMKLLPSTALYLDDGTLVAWAFLGECAGVT
ncbi:hypothetical protein ONZ43_g2830 [Nemania bipapillata]|uniref:Uncharacterized protein n=1 Tax=Nemania bipapillata TaxID=110536 RepID=A0ACC2IZ16_9PEZI|nr:hypothetical protein ONZ43_g2830 [Nemania bipapillata]